MFGRVSNNQNCRPLLALYSVRKIGAGPRKTLCCSTGRWISDNEGRKCGRSLYHLL